MPVQSDPTPSRTSARPVLFAYGFRPVLFAYGFRPFFLLGGIQAILALALWVLVVTGTLDAIAVSPDWHGHEMLFGFAVAAIAGFLLTAVPSWTGTPGLSGLPLAALVGLWLAGRLALIPGSGMPAPIAAAVDLTFLPALAVALTSPLLRARQRRNLPFPVLLGVLWTANLLVHLEWLGVAVDTARTGLILAVDVMVLMIAVVGGRIVPSFTRNALHSQGKVVAIEPHPWIERLSLATLVLLLMFDAALPESVTVGVASLAAAGLHAIRLGRWRGELTLGQPILWVLHLAYLWLPVGLALKGIGLLAAPALAAAWLHALTLGLIGTMVLGVATRVALGHTGRPLRVVRPVAVAYGLLTAAAVARVAGSALGGAAFAASLAIAGALWVAAFGLFLWIYAPILLSPRPDGRPG